jgi:hypothetical protein
MKILHAWPLQGRSKERHDVSLDHTETIYLSSSSELVYLRHRRFLPPKHLYHQWRSQFDCMIDNGEAPKNRDDKFVFEIIKNINVVFGKPVMGIKRTKSKKPTKDPSFKMQSSFFQCLPYYKEFKISHAISTVHVKKVVFESTMSLLLDIPSKAKDGLKCP